MAEIVGVVHVDWNDTTAIEDLPGYVGTHAYSIPGQYRIEVTDDGGNGGYLDFLLEVTPTIASALPDYVDVDSQVDPIPVALTGEWFTADTEVSLNEDVETWTAVTFTSDTEIGITVPVSVLQEEGMIMLPVMLRVPKDGGGYLYSESFEGIEVGTGPPA